MKKVHLLTAVAALALVGCANDDYVGQAGNPQENGGEILFQSKGMTTTRANEFTGASAAEKLGGMFVVEGTKGTEQTNSPSTTVVFDNYLVGYTANTAGTTASNTHNWEYVGKETGIADRMTSTTWNALHPAGDRVAAVQSIKYWDYSTDQYDFIAWSTGNREAVTTDPTSGSQVKVTRIATGTGLATAGFTMTAKSANDLMQCYYTDINTVTKASNNYGNVVTLTFRNMAAKVRVALYETVPGYSVKDVKFYISDANPTAPTDLGTGTSARATLFTMGSDKLPKSGAVTVYYPSIGTTHRDASPQTKDYNKASVTTAAATDGATGTTQTFGELTNQYRTATGNEKAGDKYLGLTLPTATYAGDATKDYYEAVIPNTTGKALTLRVDYTLVSTDGSDEEIHVYGAKAVVPPTYTAWMPNYAYTYVFKISDNTNGWTSQTSSDPSGLFPITFDAVVTQFVDANAEQTTITTVATPSITTYQQGHMAPGPSANDEYSKSQTAGVSDAVKDVYVQVMDNSGATPALVADLNTEGKSSLYKITKDAADYVASEAEVMTALTDRTTALDVTTIVGRNNITLTQDATNLCNTETSIVNGVDDKPITKIAGVDITAGKVAKIDIDQLETGTYAYVYATNVPDDANTENIYALALLPATPTDADVNGRYYEVNCPDAAATPLVSGTAQAGHVYFVKNTDGGTVTYTFKQTKVGESVVGLVDGGVIPSVKATSYTPGKFYFDVYLQNDGEYAVKVIKVVA